MAAKSDKSGKPQMAMRFKDMMSKDDDDDLDLFTVKNFRAKPGTSGVSAPSIRESAKRPSNLHDNKKDSNKSIFGEIKGKIPAVISRKLEELTPEEKFRDVKEFLSRKVSDDSRNQPPLTDVFQTNDMRSDFANGADVTHGINGVNVTPESSIVSSVSVIPEVMPQPPTISVEPLVPQREADLKAEAPQQELSFTSGSRDQCDSDLVAGTSDDPLSVRANLDLADPVKRSVLPESDGDVAAATESVAEAARVFEPTPAKRVEKVPVPPVPPKFPEKASPPKVLQSPLNDPLNAFLRERNERKEESSDTDSPHDSPMRSSPRVMPKANMITSSSTQKSGTPPKSSGSPPKSESPKSEEKFIDISGELSDNDLEPMEDFFGGVNRRISDSRPKLPAQTARRSSNPVTSGSETKSMSFSALKTVTSQSPEKVSKSKDPTSPRENVIKNVQEILNHDNSPQLADKPRFHEEVLEAPPTTLENSALAIKKYWRIGALLMLLLAYALTPLPGYVSGLITGALISGACMTIYILLTKPPRQREPFSVPELNSLPPFLLPEIKDCRFDEGIYKGWMNELSRYDPENYHINDTSSVFVTLEGSTLRLQRPKAPVPKRAMWNETITGPKFIHQRYYDIIGAKVSLEPANLVKKRLWSKKYPLCIKMKADKKDNDLSGRVTSSPSKEDLVDFEVVDKSECLLTLYLFSRTCREKEDWYRRFVAAAKGQPVMNHLPELSKLTYANNAQVSFQNVDEIISTVSELREDFKDNDKKRMVDYARFMAKFMPAEHMIKTLNCSHKDLTRLGHVICDNQLMWLNALIGRVLWDLLREQFWADRVYERIQKKLSKIHVPIFINEITIKDLELGTEVPIIRRASKPYLDSRGLWIDLDVAYAGGFKMTLETKCNLMKLKKVHGGATKLYSQDKPETGKSAVFNSEEEDSCESSSEEEDELPVETDNGERKRITIHRSSSGGGGKKFLRIVDKITNSKYFQQATENKYIRRAMEGVSNTPLVLSVEVHSLVGTLCVNLPAPPTDRIWYGFRTNPRLLISAMPKVGDRQVTVTHVTDWIERKIASEFQKILVLPNMDDIPIPVMNEGTVNNS